jgi:hypothetical protein
MEAVESLQLYPDLQLLIFFIICRCVAAVQAVPLNPKPFLNDLNIPTSFTHLLLLCVLLQMLDPAGAWKPLKARNYILTLATCHTTHIDRYRRFAAVQAVPVNRKPFLNELTGKTVIVKLKCCC